MANSLSSAKVGVVGIGEVGSAMADVLSEYYTVYKKDLNFDEIAGKAIDFLHICIPFNKNFYKNSVNEIKLTKPKLAIIHSTIAVGVTRKIFDKTGVPTVHSPVRGVHPYLVRDIKKFVKYVGGVDSESTKLAKKHLAKLGIKVVSMNSAEETELAKLLDTTYYGWNIIFTKLVGRLCNELNLDFGNVYTHFNKTYNQGYKKTLPHVIRPVLRYNHERDVNGGIGGHCVMSNTEVLHNLYALPFTQFLIQNDKKLKKGVFKIKKPRS